jgi:NADH dehydrogenase
MTSSRPTKVVILGGGFGGAYTAVHLQRLLPPSAVELTLVSRENFLLFTPMLHEVAASDVDVTHIVSPLRQMVRRGVLFNGEVEDIDLVEKRVRVSHVSGGHAHEIEYDHLVIALGTVTNFFRLPGVQDRAVTMKTLGDAIELRSRAIAMLEQADYEAAHGDPGDLLTFLVAGGGFAGVETAGALNDFVREALEYYPHVRDKNIRVVLVHPGDVVLPELSPELGRYAGRALAKRGIEVKTGVSVTAADDAGVRLSDGTVVPAGTIVWTAGTAPHPLVRALPCADARGKIPVTPAMEVDAWPGVWALGDAALVPDPKGRPYPPTAQHAIRQARVLAANIVAAIRGTPRRPFVFKTLGQLAAIGRRTGVANILGLKFSGFLAWFLWRTIYLSKLPRFDRKVRVALDWALDLVFSKDLVQFHTPRAPTVSHPEEPHAQRGSLPAASAGALATHG